MSANDGIMWTQRIEKEARVNLKPTSGGFSVRSAITVMDVPVRFKPGHCDPSKPSGGFHPEDFGWDPQGPTTKTFRRAMMEKESIPRERFLFPQTTTHDVGWLMMPPGDPSERTSRPPKDRLGIGWRPGGCSSVAPSAPPPLRTESEAEPVLERASSCVSAAPPIGSQVSATAPLSLEQADASASRVSAAAPSQLSRSGQQQVLSRMNRSCSSLSAAEPSQLSRATSVPGLLQADPVAYTVRREKKLTKAFEESRKYHNKGEHGQRWGRPLGETDATSFQNAFAKSTGGVPLHKYGKCGADESK